VIYAHGLRPVLQIVDHTSSIICRYLRAFYTDTKITNLQFLATETQRR